MSIADLKILLGNSIPLPEQDLDEEMVESNTGNPTEEKALQDYYFNILLENIGTDEFKENYNVVINHIKSYDIEYQSSVCIGILRTIKEVYDYETGRDIDLDNEEQINQIYSFLEFLEFNNEDFITDVWILLNPDFDKLNIEEYCDRNKDRILKAIEIQLQTTILNELISDFLRTNIKENMIEWFINKSKNLIPLAKIKKLSKETSNV